jgi:hypothetical protein
MKLVGGPSRNELVLKLSLSNYDWIGGHFVISYFRMRRFVIMSPQRENEGADY